VGKTPNDLDVMIELEKHPHGRGEDFKPEVFSAQFIETPPRAWGRPCKSAWHHARGRKHPHGRGEDQKRTAIEWKLLETPPRAWGRPRRSNSPSSRSRNTPTGVGKTVWGTSFRADLEKHPHGRGEDYPVVGVLPAAVETPPRAWGRRRLTVKSHAGSRNTPTGVGKTAAGRPR